MVAIGWPARLDQAGLGYVQRENCFTWMEDVTKAQALARAQLQSRWPTLLQPLVEQCHPHAGALCQPLALSYYWSVTESEYATDVMFKSPAALARLYPALVHQGIQHFGSTDVLRFLGHKTQANGRVHGNHQGEILSSLKHRPEGLRLKHQANGNSIKLYDKQGSVLRVETTLNRPHQFRVYRASERDPESQKRWQVLRKGIGDLHRRAELCQAINGRYLEALASVHAGQSVGELARTVCRPVKQDGRRYRGLNPWSEPDAALLEVISRGEWTLSGFRNRDVRAALHPGHTDAIEQRRAQRTGDAGVGAVAGARDHQENQRQLPLSTHPPRTANRHRVVGGAPSGCGKTHGFGSLNSLLKMHEPSSLYYRFTGPDLGLAVRALGLLSSDRILAVGTAGAEQSLSGSICVHLWWY